MEAEELIKAVDKNGLRRSGERLIVVDSDFAGSRWTRLAALPAQAEWHETTNPLQEALKACHNQI